MRTRRCSSPGLWAFVSDSNIYLSSTATSDTIANFDVGGELKFGQRSSMNGIVSIVDSFTNFASHSNLNSNFATARFASNYDDGKSKLNLNASYVETDDNQTDVINGDFRNRRNITSAAGNGEVAVTEKNQCGRRVGFCPHAISPGGLCKFRHSDTAVQLLLPDDS